MTKSLEERRDGLPLAIETPESTLSLGLLGSSERPSSSHSHLTQGIAPRSPEHALGRASGEAAEDHALGPQNVARRTVAMEAVNLSRRRTQAWT